MPVVKGGVWTNIEDEILKASVSKYGLNQWARVSSLLSKKSAKQCKARWNEWLDPSIRKTEWSKEEDEKLLHLAKLFPTQWRTIAPTVGRTANQCLERYQKLLDDAEQRENDELGLSGVGAEAAAPSADDVRRLRPGEIDTEPETKPAMPDAVDMDEDEKEMLSEARARLANTQGKKAKRKARERQLEESKRLAALQKRRELKAAGINIKVVTRKKGQMDYNADIPFEKQPAPGFYDTLDENAKNQRQMEAFDPKKQQLANKRKADQQEDGDDRKKQKKDGPSAAFAAAQNAGQMQKIREAERSSKRRSLNLPAPQVSEGELEDIVKMGMAGERATQLAGSGDNEATRGLVGNYTPMVGQTPMRTPRAPQEEDRIANEIRNARARTDTRSALLGDENADLHEDAQTTGFQGATPSKAVTATPNPLATPFRQANGIGATPMANGAGPGATPMRTPRDSFRLNQEGGMQLVAQTPRDLRLMENARRQDLQSKLAALPRPKETEWELELPEEQEETTTVELSAEDAAIRDRRNEELRRAQEMAEFKRQTQAVQRGLPRPSVIDVSAMVENAKDIDDPIARLVATEMATLVTNDALKFGGAKVTGNSTPAEIFEDNLIARARAEIEQEISADRQSAFAIDFSEQWEALHSQPGGLPGLDGYEEDEIDEHQLMTETFDNIQDKIVAAAESGNKIEKKLDLHLGGYQKRAKMLRQKVIEASDALEKEKFKLDSLKTLQISEEAAIPRRLDGLREEVGFVSRREREAQELYRARKDELAQLNEPVNGVH